jgi:hypothetical protein
MPIHNHSADTVESAWIIGDLTPGFANGNFLTETEGAGGWTQKQNAHGTHTIRTFVPEKGGSLTLLVDAETLVHQQLLAVYNLDSKPATRSQVGNFVMKDTALGEVIRWVNAYIAKRPNVVKGSESQVYSYVFNYERKEQETLNTLSNVVGN